MQSPILFILLIPKPGNVKILSVNYTTDESNEVFAFDVEIKNIGHEGTDYSVKLYNYRFFRVL